jgi:hypothetical protein
MINIILLVGDSKISHYRKPIGTKGNALHSAIEKTQPLSDVQAGR